MGFKHRSVTFFLHFNQKSSEMAINAPKCFFNRNSEHKIYYTTSDDDNKYYHLHLKLMQKCSLGLETNIRTK